MTHANQTLTPPVTRGESRAPARQSSALTSLRRAVATTTVMPFEVQLPNGTVECFAGDVGSATSESNGIAGDARFRIIARNARGLRALESLDELQIGVAYTNDDLDMDGDFLSCLDLRDVFTDHHPVRSLWRFLVPMVLGQRRSDLAWVPRHYDHGNEFYFAFLDKRYRLYSQALYTAEDEPLERAVENKLQYIVDVCRLGQGSRVLDIGGGWGALERFMGPRGIDSTMLTISHEQFKFLSDWCATHGMPCTLNVVRESIFAYEAPTPYDAITLLGVMEHLPDYSALFAQFTKLLRPGGRVYMDFAAGREKFNVSSFTYQYVFPGNHTPVYMPGLLKAAVAHGFEPIAVHNDRHSYYLTLQAWARNLDAVRHTVVPAVGEKVYRLFRLYLWGCAQQLQRDGSLESYRVVFQRASGRPSSEIGCYRPI